MLLAPPGAGKGTQANLLSRRLGLHHIASGDLLREELAKGSSPGLKAKSYMEKGTLVPDEIVIGLIVERILALSPDASFVLDGFPRNAQQADYLDRVLAEKGKTVDKVVFLKVSPQELVRRLSSRWVCRKCQQPHLGVAPSAAGKEKCQYCGGELYQRPDDVPEAVSKRLEIYSSETAPLAQYYGQRGKLVEVSGEGDVKEINKMIAAALTED